jgi:hypothetical protein
VERGSEQGRHGAASPRSRLWESREERAGEGGGASAPRVRRERGGAARGKRMNGRGRGGGGVEMKVGPTLLLLG